MAVTIGQAVGRQLAQARSRRGWTQQQLGDELRRISPATTLNRAAVAKIESGVRGTTLDEVALLAATLHLPPVALLLPLGTEDAVQVTETVEVDILSALGWFLGEERLWVEEYGWLEGVRPLELYREVREGWRSIRMAEAGIEFRREDGDEMTDEAARDIVTERVKRLYGKLRDLQAARLRVPPVPASYLDLMASLGLDVGWLRRRDLKEEA